MKVWRSEVFEEVIIVEPDVFGDRQEYFLETFQEKRYKEVGIDVAFVQDNLFFLQRGAQRASLPVAT